jgi:uncharacterized repeat protein (TIGR01451 family)
MLIGFIGLAVPITIASIQTSGQLSRNSRVYDGRLSGMYSAGAGVELALYEILSDPTFDDELTEQNPSRQLTLLLNGDPIDVTATKIFDSVTLVGQGIIVIKSVTPSAFSLGQSPTINYTITVRNEGAGTIDLKQVLDFMPPGLTYKAGSASGITTGEPTITSNDPATCGAVPQQLFWNVASEQIQVAAGGQASLTFQATGTLPEGTFYNQGAARYDPWWASPDLYVFTSSFAAPVTVGSGNPKCGYNLELLVTSSVDPEDPIPGVETEFTYTMTVENVSQSIVHVCEVIDLLPPTFTYVDDSSDEYSGNIWRPEPIKYWDSTSERWELRWADDNNSSLDPLVSLSPGEFKSQIFRALSTPVNGTDYYNEIEVTWARELTGGGNCKMSKGSAGSTPGGAGSTVNAADVYDIIAVTPTGTVRARIIYYELTGEIDILSWQES